jgi:hypothetical protein
LQILEDVKRSRPKLFSGGGKSSWFEQGWGWEVTIFGIQQTLGYKKEDIREWSANQLLNTMAFLKDLNKRQNEIINEQRKGHKRIPH